MADTGLNLQPKRLSTCLGQPLPADGDPSITGVTVDSRNVEPGNLFIALRGARGDGHDHIGMALARGASAVVTERDWPARDASPAVAIVCLPDARARASAIAAAFHGTPSRQLGCIGVTGTNGKTSVAWYLAALLNGMDRAAAYGGTLGWCFRAQRCPSTLTTEDPVVVQRRLAKLAGAGAAWVAMEVSSHALEQHRVDAVEFDVAVLTNLTRDHLDYHGTMDRYAAAKRRLFEFESLRGAVVNADDAFGAALRTQARSGLPILSFGASVDADVRWDALRLHAGGISGRLHSPWGTHDFELPLYGGFSVANVVAACCAVELAGGGFERALELAGKLTPPPGRMQFVRRAGRAPVVVDYAHTPDALAQAAAALKRHARGRLLCVFGCGGDRDPGKRPLMAAAVERHADIAWITNDNPRSESPERIAAEIAAGLTGRVPVGIELDRARAIAAAIAEATADDLVLIAGKGHEDYQEIDGQRLPFSDLACVEQALDRSAGASNSSVGSG